MSLQPTSLMLKYLQVFSLFIKWFMGEINAFQIPSCNLPASHVSPTLGSKLTDTII
jgi:hypothetical protein